MFSIKNYAVGLATMAAIALMVPASAFAASATVSGSVNAGNLSIDTSGASPSFSATLDGTDQTKPYSVPTTVIDARGAKGVGSGWNLTITSTRFSTGGGSPSTLANNASTLTGVTNTCAAGSSCTNPSNSVTYPTGVPAGTTPPTAVKYFNAAQDTGKGRFTNTPSVDVFLPATTDAGSYSSTLTLSSVAGP